VVGPRKAILKNFGSNKKSENKSFSESFSFQITSRFYKTSSIFIKNTELSCEPNARNSNSEIKTIDAIL
jgi:hypothetical protein